MLCTGMSAIATAAATAAGHGQVPANQMPSSSRTDATFPEHLVGNVSAVAALLERVLPASSAHFELSLAATCPGVPAGQACFSFADSSDGARIRITGTSASELTGGPSDFFAFSLLRTRNITYYY